MVSVCYKTMIQTRRTRRTDQSLMSTLKVTSTFPTGYNSCELLWLQNTQHPHSAETMSGADFVFSNQQICVKNCSFCICMWGGGGLSPIPLDDPLWIIIDPFTEMSAISELIFPIILIIHYFEA